MKVQLVSFVLEALFFSAKLLGFMSKAIKVFLTELVGQCRNIALGFFRIDLLSVGQYEKGFGQYIPALTDQLS